MRLDFVIVLLCLLVVAIEAKSKKKLTEGERTAGSELKSSKKKTKQGVSAIVAIEIIDPSKEGKGSKNSKRTIDSSLGYGYQSFVGTTHQQPKFEIYKYSQHDIPPYKGPANIFVGSSQDYDLKKSVEYRLPTQTSFIPHSPTNYQPGTRLYSTINQHGQLGGLSSQIPHAPNAGHGMSPVPVIILRVLPSQLNDVSHALYPNLPQSHPFAANLNSIDLQSLISNYYQGQGHSQPQYMTIQQPSKQYLPAPAAQTYLQPPPQQYQAPKAQYAAPQITYKSPQPQYEAPHSIKMPQIQYVAPEAQYEAPQQQYEAPQQHYVAPQPQYEEPQPQYEAPQQQYEAPASQIHYQAEQQYEEPQEQFLPTPIYQQDQHKSKLLTHENYPSDAHTKVIFRDHKGGIKTTQTEEPPVSTKTIKIHVPDNLKLAEVQSYDNTDYQNAPDYQQQAGQQDYQAPQDYQNYQDNDQNYYYMQIEDPYQQQSAGLEASSHQPQQKYLPVEATNSKTVYNYHAHPPHQNKKRRVRSRKNSEKREEEMIMDN